MIEIVKKVVAVAFEMGGKLEREQRLLAAGFLPASSRRRICGPEELIGAASLVLEHAPLPVSVPFALIPGAVVVNGRLPNEVAGIAAYAGLASALLGQTTYMWSANDVWLLAGELALPEGVLLTRGLSAEGEAQRWVPPWFVRAYADTVPGRHWSRLQEKATRASLTRSS